jgi:hypothetical protein
VNKLVVLNLGEGDFEQGFPVVRLEIGAEGKRPTVGIHGKLPHVREVYEYYKTWRLAYRSIGGQLRVGGKAGQTKNVSLDEINVAAKDLKTHLNLWLNSVPFRPIKDKLLEELKRDDEVRVIIQAEEVQIREIPWQLWDLFDRYPKAEVALAKMAYQWLEKSHSRKLVRILAILGNRAGINVEADKQLLENLPNAKTVFLVERSRQEINEQLWDEQGWDIISFSGHSRTKGETGKIDINETESLTIEYLRYALENAIERGLHLAIFNSCDGLGLAWQLENLHIPQVIVMREPVPDKVAQAFLKNFLFAFANDKKSFYQVVQEARKKLQGLEAQFPNASWLPVICQNPAEVPLSWNELCGNKEMVDEENLPYEPMFDSLLSKKSPSLFAQLQKIRKVVIPDLRKIPDSEYSHDSKGHAKQVLRLVSELYYPALDSSFNANELFVIGVLCLVHDIGMMPRDNCTDSKKLYNNHCQYSHDYVMSMISNKVLYGDVSEKIARLCLIHNKRIGRARAQLESLQSPDMRLVLIYAMFKIADMLEVEQQPGAILRTLCPDVITNNIGEFDIDSKSQTLTFYPTPEAEPKYFDKLVQTFSEYFQEAEPEFKLVGLNNYRVIQKT